MARKKKGPAKRLHEQITCSFTAEQLIQIRRIADQEEAYEGRAAPVIRRLVAEALAARGRRRWKVREAS